MLCQILHREANILPKNFPRLTSVSYTFFRCFQIKKEMNWFFSVLLCLFLYLFFFFFFYPFLFLMEFISFFLIIIIIILYSFNLSATDDVSQIRKGMNWFFSALLCLFLSIFFFFFFFFMEFDFLVK